jgi:mRNA interferase RelE/StbE
MFDIEWTKTAIKQLTKIQPVKQRESIASAVLKLKECPTTQTNVKVLKQHKAGYRLRVGNYRVLFDSEDCVRIVTIQEVKKRDDRTY